MKGLTHFFSGVTLASFFTSAVSAAALTKSGNPDAANSFILVLGGVFGILPDTFDFKLGRFFAKEDLTLRFDENDPDPQDMANQIGMALDKAAEENRFIQIQFNPMRMGANLWRQYVVNYDGQRNEIAVVINEIVSTSQLPFPGTEPVPEKRIGIYKLKNAEFLEKHSKPTGVDILSGPMMGYKPLVVDGKKVIAVEFLPWHRTWSHSYVLGLMLSLVVTGITWGLELHNWWLYGLIAFLGFAVHITEDLTGHMGGSLIWPFYGKRFDGFCWFKASDPRTNFTVDYVCLTILLFNLDRGTFDNPVIPLPWYLYFFLFTIIPLAIYHIIYLLAAEPIVKEGVVKAESLLARHNAERNAEAVMEQESPIG
ncbi:MAG: metal-dependent hydrolase [Candidatus Ozemobacteraceae bacterium]